MLAPTPSTLRAEIVPGVVPSWFVLSVSPGQENVAAANLAGRGFGVYVPRYNRVTSRHGKERRYCGAIFPGYVFVFVWDVTRHRGRIRACPGAVDLLCGSGSDAPVSIADEHIHAFQALEREEFQAVLVTDVAWPKRNSRRPRRSKRIRKTLPAAWQNLDRLDSEGRNRLLRKILGLSS